MGFIKTIRNILFPNDIKCIVCDRELDKTNKYGLCDKCELPAVKKFCLKCGRAMNNLADYCLECQHREWNFDKARAAVVYDENARNLVLGLKYGNRRYLKNQMAEFMADTYFENEYAADLVTFVPLHKKRRRFRGYNQAELLAKELSEKLKLPCETFLKKTVHVKNSAKLSRKERAEAIKDTFAFVGKDSLKGKSVLLVDDVFTTGATVNECARVLKTDGKAAEVLVLTFATGKIIPPTY